MRKKREDNQAAEEDQEVIVALAKEEKVEKKQVKSRRITKHLVKVDSTNRIWSRVKSIRNASRWPCLALPPPYDTIQQLCARAASSFEMKSTNMSKWRERKTLVKKKKKEKFLSTRV